jgi:hypothetical protein
MNCGYNFKDLRCGSVPLSSCATTKISRTRDAPTLRGWALQTCRSEALWVEVSLIETARQGVYSTTATPRTDP